MPKRTQRPVADPLAVTDGVLELLKSGALTLDNGNLDLAIGGVEQTHTAFDPALQSDLDNHTSNATAHHSKPTSTQSEQITGGYKTPNITNSSGVDSGTDVNDDSTGTTAYYTSGDSQSFALGNSSVNGLRIHLSGIGSNGTLEVQADGNTVVSDSSPSTGTWVSYSFGQVASEVTVIASGDWMDVNEIDLNAVYLPNHSHSI